MSITSVIVLDFATTIAVGENASSCRFCEAIVVHGLVPLYRASERLCLWNGALTRSPPHINLKRNYVVFVATYIGSLKFVILNCIPLILSEGTSSTCFISFNILYMYTKLGAMQSFAGWISKMVSWKCNSYLFYFHKSLFLKWLNIQHV